MVSTRTPLVLRYFIWSMLIFAISMGIWGFRVLRSLELKSLSISLPFRQYPHWRYYKEIEIPVLSVPVYGQISEERYLETARDVVHHLRKAGAKVVIVPLPEYFPPTPKALKAIDEILKDSIAILGAPNPLTSSYAQLDNRPFDRRSLWWVEHPLHNQRKMPWGVVTAHSEFISPVVRFMPTGFRESRGGAPVWDVSVLALRRYFDIPDDADIQPYASRLQIGSFAIPIAKDGISYLRQAFRPKVGAILAANFDILADSIRYYPNWTSEKLWAKHQGKIVLLDGYGLRPFQFQNYTWLYLQVFASVFQRSFLSLHSEWNVLLITTLVILLSVFSYTMRNGLTVLLSFALIVATLIISTWLFDSYNVIFDPIYDLVPIMLCGIILPIVKTSGEKKIAEAAVKSLEAENKRLHELQRRSTHDPHF
jgi:hypothetical protein